MSTATSFVTGAGMGLLAGLTTCAALHTGLLAGLAGRPGARPARLVPLFLTGRLLAHAALGALLGGAGAAVQPGPLVHAVLLALSAAVLASFALRLVRPRPSAGHGCPSGGRPPDPRERARTILASLRSSSPSGGRPPDPRERARTILASLRSSVPSWLGGPPAVGAATVFVPCGITLSAELLAVASGSAAEGAAIMSGFVLGTAPLAGALGLGAGLLRGLPSRLLGVALLGVAGWTLLGAVRLGGLLPDGSAAPAIDARFVSTDASGVQTVTVHALDRGYRPALLSARAHVPTVLVLSTRGTTGCTRAFTLPARGIWLLLPETGETRLDLGVPAPGRVRFVCSAGHYPGSITFR